MGRKILVLKNVFREGPGLLAEVLDERGVGCDVAYVDDHPGLDGYGALVVLGGPASANDGSETMLSLVEFMAGALGRGIPCLGVCLGLQAMVKAAGGRVGHALHREIGLRGPDGGLFSIKLTEEGRADPLFEGMANSLTVFQLHGEMAEPTEDMSLLATGKYCRSQVVRVRPGAYGIQGHFELTAGMLSTWAAEDPDLRCLNAAELQGDFKAIGSSYAKAGRRLFHNFLGIAGF